MSCYACTTKFSFFTREHSCPSCGFSYCNKCLREEVTLGDKRKNVCANCHKKLTSNSDIMASSDSDTPGLLLKRLENLENPAKPPITIYQNRTRLDDVISGLKNKEILERLEKLRGRHKAEMLPDETEIRRRLALLQDRSEESIDEKPQSLKVSSKSNQEQVDELLNQYVDETGLNANLEGDEKNAIDEIRERLNKLQATGKNPPAVSDSSTLQSEDEDVVTAKIIMKAIAEGKLEKKLEKSMETNDEKEDDNDDDDEDLDISDSNHSEEEADVPWCIICNEDATVKCFGCDGNLYCENCFKQGHEYFNMDDHKFIPYTRKDSS